MAKSAKNVAAKKSKAHRKNKQSWSVYIHRSMKQVNKSLSLSGKTMKIVNSFVTDVFERVATEASALARANKKKTLGSREIQTAVRLVLPVELARHAMSEGTKAVAKASA